MRKFVIAAVVAIAGAATVAAPANAGGGFGGPGFFKPGIGKPHHPKPHHPKHHGHNWGAFGAGLALGVIANGVATQRVPDDCYFVKGRNKYGKRVYYKVCE